MNKARGGEMPRALVFSKLYEEQKKDGNLPQLAIGKVADVVGSYPLDA